MKLDGVDSLFDVLYSGNRRCRLPHQPEPRGQLQSFVAVRHPHRHLRWQSFQQHGTVEDIHIGVAVFALYAGPHLAAELVRNELQPVANAEHRQPERQHLGVRRRGVGVIHRARPAREDDADRVIAFDLRDGSGARENGGKDVLLANATRNQLRILRAEIKNNDGFKCGVFHGLISQNRVRL